MENKQEPVFLKVTDAAARVGVTPFYLRQRIAAGTAPFIYCGRRILVNVPKLTEILTAESTNNLAQSGCN